MADLTNYDKRLMAKYSTAHWIVTSKDSGVGQRLRENGITTGIGLVEGRRVYWQFTDYGRHEVFQAWFALTREG